MREVPGRADAGMVAKVDGPLLSPGGYFTRITSLHPFLSALNIFWISIGWSSSRGWPVFSVRDPSLFISIARMCTLTPAKILITSMPNHNFWLRNITFWSVGKFMLEESCCRSGGFNGLDKWYRLCFGWSYEDGTWKRVQMSLNAPLLPVGLAHETRAEWISTFMNPFLHKFVALN